jgi:hypothetical protein
MAARLVISETQYVLQQARDGRWIDVAVLPGGAESVLPAKGPVDERRLEIAIQATEDWLMPHAPGLQGEALEVADRLQRIKSGMADVLSVTSSRWTVDEVEQFFARVVDLATGRVPSPLLAGRQSFVADLLVLRELAHHGRLAGIHLS